MENPNSTEDPDLVYQPMPPSALKEYSSEQKLSTTNNKKRKKPCLSSSALRPQNAVVTASNTYSVNLA